MSQFNPQMSGSPQAFQQLQAKAMEKKGAELAAYSQNAQRFASEGMGIARDLISQSYQGELGPTAGLAAEGLPGEFQRFTPGTEIFRRKQELDANRRATNREHNRRLGKVQAEIAGLGQNKANRQQSFQRVLQRYAGEMTNSQSNQAAIQGLSDAIGQKQHRLMMLSSGGVLGMSAFGAGETGEVTGGMSEAIERVMAEQGLSRYQAAKQLMEVPGQTMENNVTQANIAGAIGDFMQGVGESIGLTGGGILGTAGATGLFLSTGPIGIGVSAVAATLGALGIFDGFNLMGDDTIEEVEASVKDALREFKPNTDAALQANLLVISEEISKLSGNGAQGAEAVFDGLNQLMGALGKSTNPNDEDVLAILDKVGELKETHGVSLEQLYHGLAALEQSTEARRVALYTDRVAIETKLGAEGGVVNTEESRLALKVFRQGEQAESEMADKLARARGLLESAGDKLTNPEHRFYEASERAQAAEDILDGTLDGLVMPDGTLTADAEEMFAVIDPNVAGKLRDFLDKKMSEEAQLLGLQGQETELGELLDPLLSPEIAEYEAQLADLAQQNAERNISIQRERDTESQLVGSLIQQINQNLEGMR